MVAFCTADVFPLATPRFSSITMSQVIQPTASQDYLCNGDLSTTTLGWPVSIYNRLPMTAFLLAPLLLIAYGALCLLAPEKHLAFNAWLNRRSRMKWHKHRAYTTPGLRMERRWSQLTPANLRRIRVTGIAFACMGLWIIWEYWRVHR